MNKINIYIYKCICDVLISVQETETINVLLPWKRNKKLIELVQQLLIFFDEIWKYKLTYLTETEKIIYISER